MIRTADVEHRRDWLNEKKLARKLSAYAQLWRERVKVSYDGNNGKEAKRYLTPDYARHFSTFGAEPAGESPVVTFLRSHRAALEGKRLGLAANAA